MKWQLQVLLSWLVTEESELKMSLKNKLHKITHFPMKTYITIHIPTERTWAFIKC